MADYPVNYAVDPPTRFTRLQLAIRVVAFLALGTIGVSFGALFLFAYLGLPVYAASRLAAAHNAEDYQREDGPRIVRLLGWFAALSAWVGLTAEQLPSNSPSETVRLTVDSRARPTAESAAWRVVTGLPSALVLALLGWLGLIVWLWAAISILLSERVGRGAFDYLVGLQRWSLRLLAYQASLVDEYPPFSFADGEPGFSGSHKSPS